MSSAESSSGDDKHRGKRSFLLRSAASLVSTSLVTAGLGFIYWAVAARMFPASDVGESATAIAAMNLIAPFTALGFGTTLVSHLPAMRSGRPELVSTAAVAATVSGGVVALVCGFVLPGDFLGLPGIGHELFATMLFAAGVAAQSVATMLDTALLSVLGGGIQLGRNVIHAVAKLVLLVIFALTLSTLGSLSIYASWFLANAISIAAVTVWLLHQRRVHVRRIWPRPSTLRGLQFKAAKHHALNLSLQVPYFAMPIVANATLGSEMAGYLYGTWSVASFVFTLPIALSWALFASGARDSSTILTEFRLTVRFSLATVLAAILLILPLGGLVLSVFGAAYAENGRTALTVLCIGGLGMVVKDHHVALARITGTVGREAILLWTLGAGELVGAAIGAKLGGITGLSLGWLAAVGLEVLVCGPLVWRQYRGRLPAAAHTTTGG